MAETLSLLGILGAMTVEDLRSRRVSVTGLLAAAIGGLCLHLYFGRITIWNVLGGMAIGAMLYIVSVLSRERIGKGDALLLGVTGIYLGFWGNLLLLWIAMLLASMGGLAAVVLFRKGRQDELPFVPFVLVGYVGCLLLWGGRLL